MIARISHGVGFRGLCAYVLRENRAGEALLLGGTMSGRAAREIAHEFQVFRRLNPRVKKPAFHASLRLPVGDALTDAQWRGVARDYLAQLGYYDTAYMVVKHPPSHVHLVASRVRFDGSRVPMWRERWISLAAMAELERRYGLTPLRVQDTREQPARLLRLRPEEERLAARLGETPVKAEMARRIDRALAGCDGTPDGFAQGLAMAGVEVRWHHGEEGQVLGAAYRLVDYAGSQRATMAGSRLGGLYAWPELAARLAGQTAAREAAHEPARAGAREPDRPQVRDREVWGPARRDRLPAEPLYERGGR